MLPKPSNLPGNLTQLPALALPHLNHLLFPSFVSNGTQFSPELMTGSTFSRLWQTRARCLEVTGTRVISYYLPSCTIFHQIEQPQCGKASVPHNMN